MFKNLNQFLLIICLFCFSSSLPMKKILKSHRKLADDFKSVTLTFVKAYDLSFVDGYWKFKILVKGDEKLAENDKVKVDIASGEGSALENGYSECTFKDHVLDCGGGDKTNNNAKLLRILSIKSAGTVFWNYPGDQYLSIPLNHSLTFKSAYGAFFTGKWNFLVKYTNTGVSPKNSLVIIDIIQNSKETTASCHLLYQGSNSQVEEMYCVSDYPNQLSNDVVKINTNKKYGSISWTPAITGENNNIPSAEEKEAITLTLVDAYDLHYTTSNHIWSFIIEGSSPSVKTVGIYKADISIKKYSGSQETKGIAKCLLYDGVNTNVKFICTCDYEEQNSRDLIKLLSKDKGTITLSGSFTSPYSITLKTELFQSKIEEVTQTGGIYTFKLNVIDGILPVDSKVIVSITYSPTSGRVYAKATCNADSSVLLSCETDTSVTSQPNYYHIRLEGASLTCKNYESLKLDVRYVSKYEYDTYLGRFKFNVTITNGSIPLNTLTRIPTTYKGQIKSSSCILIESKKFECTVIHEPQKNSDSFSLPKTGAGESSFINYKSENVKFANHLFFKKAYNLKFKENKWQFNILLSESNLKDKQSLEIDVLVDETASKASCNLDSNILSCEVKAENQKLENIIAITNNDKNNDLVWHDIANTVTLDLALEIKFKGVNGLFNDNNWKFKVFYEAIGNDNYDGLSTSLAISVNSEPGKAICKIQESSILECKPSYYRQKKEDVIKIIGSSEPGLGAVSFNPALTEEIEVKPVSIELNYKYKEKYSVNTYLYFNIIGELPNDITTEIEKGSFTEIKMSKNTEKENTADVPCTTNKIEKVKGSAVNITCETLFNERDEVSIVRDKDGKSGYVKIILDQEGDIDLTQTDKPSADDNKENPTTGGGDNSSYYNEFTILYLVLLILL